MYTFAYKYGRKISHAPLFVHYTHSGASFACVNARATRGVDQIVDDDEAGAGAAPGAGPQSAGRSQRAIEHHPCQPLPYVSVLSLQRPVSVVSFRPFVLCRVGRSIFHVIMSIHKIHAGFWAENLITCLDNR